MEYQHFFMQAKAYSQPDKPALPENVRRALNIQHFADNAQLLELLNPVANLIRKLESSSTSLDDIFIGMLRLYTWYDLNMDMANKYRSGLRPLIDAILNKYMKPPIYVVAIYLNPKYQDFAVSLHYTHQQIHKLALQQAKDWGFSIKKSKKLYEQLINYSTMDIQKQPPKIFWTGKLDVLKEISTFALMIFELKGHAARVESLFSALSFTKSKARSRMTPENLKMISILKHELIKKAPKVDEHAKKNRVQIFL